MWKKLFKRRKRKIFTSNETPYTTLAPFSYDWIFRCSSTLSTSCESMPPLVKPPSSPGGCVTPDINSKKNKVKCVLVGDGAVGKTSLIVSYTTNGYPDEYVPTAFDNYNVNVNIDNCPIKFQLCDTAGQDDFDSLRSLCYPGCDVFVVCFSVTSPTSFRNVRDKWLPELRLHNPTVPIVLVGTQSDLRTDVKVLIELAQYNEQPVSETSAVKLANNVGAVAYVESSALTQKNLKEVFDEALLAALNPVPPFKRTQSIMKRMQRPIGEFLQRRHSTVLPSCAGSRENTGSSRKKGWRRLCCFTL